MNLEAILSAIAAAAGALGPIVPAAAIVAIGATTVKAVVDALEQKGTQVVDENGNVLTKEELVARAQARWDEASTLAREGSAIAERELDRTE